MIFKQVFRIAFITLIWKQYKHVIVSTLLLFLFLFLASSVHSDYLRNAEIQGDTANTGISFIYKWAAFICSTVVYFAYHYFRSGKPKSIKDKQQKIAQELDELPDDDDPFAAIRARKKLRSRADFMIDENKEKDS